MWKLGFSTRFQKRNARAFLIAKFGRFLDVEPGRFLGIRNPLGFLVSKPVRFLGFETR